MLIEIQFFHNFLYNTNKPIRIYYVNHTYVIRGYLRSKQGKKKTGKKKIKKAKNIKMHLEMSFFK